MPVDYSKYYKNGWPTEFALSHAVIEAGRDHFIDIVPAFVIVKNQSGSDVVDGRLFYSGAPDLSISGYNQKKLYIELKRHRYSRLKSNQKVVFSALRRMGYDPLVFWGTGNLEVDKRRFLDTIAERWNFDEGGEPTECGRCGKQFPNLHHAAMVLEDFAICPQCHIEQYKTL